MEAEKVLNKIGEFDYDFKNDILLFKVKEREYSHSVELHNLIIDFDEENFIVAIQIIGASGVFQLSKEQLKGIKNFMMKCKINDGLIQINLEFNMTVRNKPVQYKPIIFQEIGKNIPNSMVTCEV